jgi:hypothetical protein
VSKLFSYNNSVYLAPGFPIGIFLCGTVEGGSGIWQLGNAMRYCLLTSIRSYRKSHRHKMVTVMKTPTSQQEKEMRVKRKVTRVMMKMRVSENDNDLVAANNDVELVTAAGFADL